MTDSEQERQAIIDELLTLMSKRQLHLLIACLGQVREHSHGEVSLRVVGERMFITRKESHDGGAMPPLDPNSDC